MQRATPNAIDSDRRVADLPQCQNISILGKRPGPSEAQKEQVKRRRTKEAEVFCKIPGCGGDFTTGGRLESKSPLFFPSPYSAPFLKISNPSFGSSYNGDPSRYQELYLCMARVFLCNRLRNRP